MTGGQHYEPCVLNGDGECHRWNHAHPKPRCVDGWCGPWRDGVCVDCGNLRNYTPTPVPSEVAETTAGEREIEALLYAHREDALTCYDHPEAYCCVCGAHEVGGHRSHLAHTIAALLDRVRREEGAKVLREAAATFAWAGWDEDYRSFRDWLNARAASVGRGEGL